MPIKSRVDLKAKFANGNIPFQEDFWDLIDTLISQSEDGLSIIRNADSSVTLGLGVTGNGAAPLAIKRQGTKELLISFHDDTQHANWGFLTLNQKDFPGFNVVQVDTKNTISSRLFIDSRTGQVGFGTESPKSHLYVQASKSNAGVGLGVRNSAVVSQTGWFFLHVNDNTITSRNGALGIFDAGSAGSQGTERVVIMPTTGYVGINEKTPDTFLHVSRPESNADSLIDLREQTGIAQIGTVTKSILFDYQGIQARQGAYISNTLQLDVSTLNLQRLGGDTLWHNDPDTPETEKVVIKTNGRVGVGVLLPSEKLHVDGRLIISDSAENPLAGAIRWSGTDFEGYDGANWLSMTGGNASMWSSAGTDKITYNPAKAMVGIGIDVPTSMLHVSNDETVNAGSTSVRIVNTASTSSDQGSDSRIGLDISCSGLWSDATGSKSIGLVVSSSGAGTANTNLAAVLNGNVSIGPVSNSHEMVGANGSNVLVIQNGAAPSAQVGGSSVTDGGVQLYSQLDADGVSVFNLKNGNNDTIQLFKGAALTAANTDTIDDAYTITEANIISNLRVRLNELEARLKALGLLA